MALSFDSDHETIPLRDAEVSPGRLSQGEYGSRVGTPRILALLKRFGASATFFMPAVSALLHPEEARGYVEVGHEVGVHGWIHERNMLLSGDTERELARRSTDTLEKVTGVRPVGIRTPSWDFSDHTLAIIRDPDSSTTLAHGRRRAARLLADGIPTGLVEIPVEWIRDDARTSRCNATAESARTPHPEAR